MSNQVGDIKTFAIQGTVPVGSDLTYVWQWWDGDVTVSKNQSVQKALNMGGILAYSCTVVSPSGDSAKYLQTIVINAPPAFLGSPVVSANDQPLPFYGTITSKAYDPEGTGVYFKWFSGTNFLSSGTTTVANGTGTNFYAFPVVEASKITLAVTDHYGTLTDAGTRKLDFEFRGFDPSGPMAGFSATPNTLISNTSNLPVTVIGPGQSINFTAYGRDEISGSLAFQWSFLTLNGWSSDSSSSGTSAALANGVTQNYLSKGVSTETPGEKVAVCVVTNSSTGANTTVRSTVTLEESFAPVVSNISTSATIAGAAYGVPVGGYVSYTGTAADANGDLVTYKWALSQPADVIFYGRTLFLRPLDYPETSVSGREIVGALVVSDKFGETGTLALPRVITI